MHMQEKLASVSEKAILLEEKIILYKPSGSYVVGKENEKTTPLMKQKGHEELRETVAKPALNSKLIVVMFGL